MLLLFAAFILLGSVSSESASETGSKSGSSESGSGSSGSWSGEKMGMMGRKCNGSWTDWEQTKKCVWPGSFTKADAPEACMTLPPKPAKMPDLPYQLLQQKYDDYFNQWQYQMQERGIGAKPCGMCGFKLKCRQLAQAPTHMHCPVKEKLFVTDSQCDSDVPCALKMEKGGCEAPEVMDMMHFLSFMSAMNHRARVDIEDIMYGHKIEQFMTMMIGAPQMMMGPRMMKGNKKSYGGKMKSKSSSDSSSKSSKSESESSSGEDNDIQKKLDDLVETLSGKDKDEVLDSLKNTMTLDGPAAAKIKEAVEAFKGLISRKKRQVTEGLADNESYLAPKANCVPNKDNTGCLCCCNWHIPDRENNKCVNIRDAMITFIKDFDMNAYM